MLVIVVFIEYNGRGDDQSGMVLLACSTCEVWAWGTQEKKAGHWILREQSVVLNFGNDRNNH